MTARRIGWALALAAVVIRIVYWRHTGRVWEDSLITILHAENAVAGLGLTHFKPDEPPVHGFTSPLSVLIPLVGEWLHPGSALGAIRIASLAAAFASVLAAARIAEAKPELGLTPPLVALVCGYLAFEHHQVHWGMAGMETQVAVCVLLASILFLARRRHILLGVSLGMCMLARPDFAVWALVVGGWLALEALRTREWKPLALTVGIALAIYLPWIAFAWSYYGNPIPNTIVAKAAGYPGYWWRNDFSPGYWLRGTGYITWAWLMPALGPAFAGNGTGFVRLFDPGVAATAMGVAIVASLVAAIARRQGFVLMLHAFFWAYAAYFVFLVPMMFAWYLSPFLAVGVLLAAHGLGSLWSLLPRAGPRLAWGATATYLAVIVAALPITFRGERHVQRLEEHVRIAIGRHLRETSPPSATIGGEPLGFIGYYSRRAYYDYPGLASRRVVEHVRSGHPGLAEMLRYIAPDYIVLRDFELRDLAATRAWLDERYVVERRFEAPADVRARMLAPERNIDQAFTLFRKRAG